MNQLGHELFACTPRVTPMRHTPEPHEIARDRRARLRDRRAKLTHTRGRINERVWHARRRWTAPHAARGVEKLLDGDGLIISNMINAMNGGFHDRGLCRA